MNIDVAIAFSWYIVFLFSTTLHEAAHAWAAKKGGDLTAYAGGQVSLDPIPHIRRSPFGMVVMPLISVFVFGFPMGFASAPYDPYWAARYPKRAAWMALAGPGSNLLMVILACVLFKIGIAQGLLESTQLHGVMPEIYQFAMPVDGSLYVEKGAMILSMFLTLNLLLFILNMLPFPPLDGSAALPLFIGERLGLRVQDFFNNPGASIIGLIIAWNLIPQIFWPAIRIVLDMLGLIL